MNYFCENRYKNDDELLINFINKVLLKNSHKISKVMGVGALMIMAYCFVKRQMIEGTVFAVCAALMYISIKIFPKKILKNIKKNDIKITGGGENIFRFGDKIYIEQGKSKTKLAYEQLNKHFEIDEAHVFRLNKSNYLILKKNCFTQGSWSELKNAIKRNNSKIKFNEMKK